MPALAMAIVYFGYIARMTRAGTIEVLESDYTRTATMKGLTTGQTMRRHVLRNALIPTVAVIAVQIGYLFGGIIAVERIFNYNGMGQTMLFAAERKDIPMLTAGAIVIGIVYMVATLVGRPDHRLDESPDPAGRGALMDVRSSQPMPLPDGSPPVSERAQARRETLVSSSGGPRSSSADIVSLLDPHCHPRRADHPVRPVQRLRGGPSAAGHGAPRSARTGSAGTSCRGSWSGRATC